MGQIPTLLFLREKRIPSITRKHINGIGWHTYFIETWEYESKVVKAMLSSYQQMEIENLRLRVRDLEAKMQSLRLDRRILMNLLETAEKDKWRELEVLVRYNNRLKRDNRRYARLLMEQNRRILALQEEIRQLGSREAGDMGAEHGNTKQ